MPTTTTPNVSDPMNTALVPIVLSNEIVHYTSANHPPLKPDPRPPDRFSQKHFLENILMKLAKVDKTETDDEQHCRGREYTSRAIVVWIIT